MTLDINPRESGNAGRDGITYVAGTVVNLEAEPNDCYVFQAWSPNAPGGVVTMTEPKTVTVAFAPDGAKAVSQVQVTGGTLEYNPGTQRYQQSVTLHNYGGALTGVALVLDGLTGVAGLYQPSGSTYCALPAESAFREVGTMAAGQSVALTLEFPGPQNGPFGYTARVLAGAGQR